MSEQTALEKIYESLGRMEANLENALRKGEDHEARLRKVENVLLKATTVASVVACLVTIALKLLFK